MSPVLSGACMNLCEFLHASPGDGVRPVMLYRGVELTRAEMFARAHQLAQALYRAGLRPGDRVGVAIANPAIFLTSLLGLAQAGMVGMAVKPDEPMWHDGERWQALRLAWVFHDRLAWPTAAGGGTGPRAMSAREVFMTPPPRELSMRPGEADMAERPWLLARSSGTTGQPKTVVVSQAAFQASLMLGEQFESHDRVMLFLEISMYWAIATAFRVVRGAGLAILETTDLLPAQVLQALVESRANVLVLSADAASKIASYALDFPQELPPLHLTRVIIGGGRVSPKVRHVFQNRWGARVLVLYGSTEMGPMAVWGEEAASDVEHYVLEPYAGVQLEVVDGQGTVLPVGDEGYLRLRSPALFSGYLQDDGQWPTQAPEWFYPGDLACLTSDGGIELRGRADHVLNLGGRKVDPELIEEALRNHPAVQDAGVTSAPMGPAQVQMLVGLLVLKEGHGVDEVRAHCRQVLPRIQQPEFWMVVSSLPRNVSGKLQRQRLAQMVRLERA